MHRTDDFKTLIETRIAELEDRLGGIEKALDQPLDADLSDQAIDLEDDEVLESLGHAGQQELGLLQQALARIEAGTFGTCQQCGETISPERLNAVPHAMTCRTCAAGA